jgi:hypothetical protein
MRKIVSKRKIRAVPALKRKIEGDFAGAIDLTEYSMLCHI